MPSIGDIYLVRVYFDGRSGVNKSRPVLIINAQPEFNLYTVVECTSVPPKEGSYYGQFKVKLLHWREYGLNQETYIRCKNTHRIEGKRLYKKLGSMNEGEFLQVIEKIIEWNS